VAAGAHGDDDTSADHSDHEDDAEDGDGADGSEANLDTGAMLHHNVLFESWHDDLTCARDSAIGFLGRRFFASGNERTGAGFPKDYGLWIDNTPWSGIFEIMNHRDVPQTVYFQLHVRYLSGSETLKRLTPVWLDVDNCEDSQYAIKAGTTEQAWDWTSSITGRVITTVGHVHDTGVAITLSNGSTGENMCRSVAGYGADPSYMGAIESMSLCSWDRLGTVRQGEKLRITARYQATEAHDDVMGIMMAYVYETKDLSGGTQAPPEMANPPMEAPPAEDDHDH